MLFTGTRVIHPNSIVNLALFWYNISEQKTFFQTILMDGPEPHNKLTREQKVGVALLFVFSILTAGLAFLQMRNTIVSPFVLHTTPTESKKTLEELQLERQNIDTDHDGINDLEESQFYGTSAYLADTDSDGTTDKAEIDAGTDPLCAEGKICEVASATGKTETPSLPPSIDTPLNALARSLPTDGQDTVTSDDVEAVGSLMNDPQKIRALLKETGQVTDEQLQKLDDATLLKILQQIISSTPPPAQEKNSAPEANVTSTASTTTQIPTQTPTSTSVKKGL